MPRAPPPAACRAVHARRAYMSRGRMVVRQRQPTRAAPVTSGVLAGFDLMLQPRVAPKAIVSTAQLVDCLSKLRGRRRRGDGDEPTRTRIDSTAASSSSLPGTPAAVRHLNPPGPPGARRGAASDATVLDHARGTSAHTDTEAITVPTTATDAAGDRIPEAGVEAMPTGEPAARTDDGAASAVPNAPTDLLGANANAAGDDDDDADMVLPWHGAAAVVVRDLRAPGDARGRWWAATTPQRVGLLRGFAAAGAGAADEVVHLLAASLVGAWLTLPEASTVLLALAQMRSGDRGLAWDVLQQVLGHVASVVAPRPSDAAPCAMALRALALLPSVGGSVDDADKAALIAACARSFRAAGGIDVSGAADARPSRPAGLARAAPTIAEVGWVLFGMAELSCRDDAFIRDLSAYVLAASPVPANFVAQIMHGFRHCEHDDPVLMTHLLDALLGGRGGGGRGSPTEGTPSPSPPPPQSKRDRRHSITCALEVLTMPASDYPLELQLQYLRPLMQSLTDAHVDSCGVKDMAIAARAVARVSGRARVPQGAVRSVGQLLKALERRRWQPRTRMDHEYLGVLAAGCARLATPLQWVRRALRVLDPRYVRPFDAVWLVHYVRMAGRHAGGGSSGGGYIVDESAFAVYVEKALECTLDAGEQRKLSTRERSMLQAALNIVREGGRERQWRMSGAAVGCEEGRTRLQVGQVMNDVIMAGGNMKRQVGTPLVKIPPRQATPLLPFTYEKVDLLAPFSAAEKQRISDRIPRADPRARGLRNPPWKLSARAHGKGALRFAMRHGALQKGDDR